MNNKKIDYYGAVKNCTYNYLEYFLSDITH